MSAHRSLNDFFRAFEPQGPGNLVDPGASGTITFSMWGQICSVVTATAESRTLDQAIRPGILAAICLKTDGGNLTLTVTGGYNRDADTSITFADAGDYVILYSVDIGGSYYWRVIAQEGTSAAMEDSTFDSLVVGTMSAASVLVTSISAATAMSAASILATNVSASNLTADNLTATTTAISVPAITATNITIGTGLTVPSIVAATAASIKSVLATNLSVGTGATIPNILCSSNLSAASIKATNLSVATGATIPNIVATSAMTLNSGLMTNLSVGTQATIPNIVCSSNLSVASVLATNISIGTALSVASILGTNVSVGAATVTGNMVRGAGTIMVTGGSAAVDTQATVVNSPNMAMLSVGTATKNYFKLPVAAQGIVCNVVNLGASTAGLIGHTAGVSFASATSTALATVGASGSALNLVCDGTNWWKRAL